jgi:hypothetical protein
MQIESIKQMVVQRHAESNKLLHGSLASSTIFKNVASWEAQINK